MVPEAPGSHPARLLPYLAAGAASGVAIREVLMSVWPAPAQQLLSVLLFTMAASFALGWMFAVPVPPRLLAVGWGWSGALCSISAITTFALRVPPQWGLPCIALVPLCAAAGVAVGAIAPIRRRRRGRTAGGTVK